MNTEEFTQSYESLRPIFQKQREGESCELHHLFKALSQAQNEIRVAKKDTENPFFKSSYADLAAVVAAAKEALAKNGLSVIQRVELSSEGRHMLLTRLCHESGQWIESKMLLLPAKHDMQALGSAITYAKRYSYAAIVGVVTEEEDDDAEKAMGRNGSSQPERVSITRAQTELLSSLISKKEDKNTLAKILSHYRISKLSDMPKGSFQECYEKLKGGS